MSLLDTQNTQKFVYHRTKRVNLPPLLYNSWTITDFYNSFGDFPKIFSRTWLCNLFLDMTLTWVIADISTELPCSGDRKNPGQLPVQEVLMILLKFLKFLHYLCFQGQGIHCWYSYWATLFEWPGKSRSTPGSRGIRRYWWLCLIDFYSFAIINVFEGKESNSGIPTELPCLSDLENLGHLPV